MNLKDRLQQSSVNFNAWVFLKRLQRRYPRDPEKLRKLQLKKLRRLLIHAYEQHGFYRQRMDSSSLNPCKLADLGELQKLPPLTKEEYRSFTNSLLERNPDKYRNWHFNQTSGSTGTPLKIIRSWPEHSYMRAKWLRAAYMNGYRCTDHTLRILAPHKMTGRKDSFLQLLGLFKNTQISTFSSGREMAEEFLWEDGTRSGRVLPYEIMGCYSAQISRFKIIQETWDLIRILVILVPGLDRADEKNRLRSDIIKKMEDGIRKGITYQVEFTENIPPDENGKMGILSSKVDKIEWQKKTETQRDITCRLAKDPHQ